MLSQSRSTGFTLVELLVTITILAIAAAIATPSLVNIVRDNRVSAHTNEFVALVTFARSEAVKRRGEISLVIEDANPNGWSAEVCLTPDCDDAQDPIRSADYEGTPVFVANPGTIIFTEMGRVLTERTVSFQHQPCGQQQHRREVTVTTSGLLSTLRTGCIE